MTLPVTDARCLSYTAFERNITVYATDATTAKNVLTTGANNIKSICEEASFELAADKGCCHGQLVLRPVNSDGRTNLGASYLLNAGDVIYFIPEGTDLADAKYCGQVLQRRRVINEAGVRHHYVLDGLATRLQGCSPVDDCDYDHAFGTMSEVPVDVRIPNSTYQHEGVYYVSCDSGLGIVQWIAYNIIDEKIQGIITDGSVTPWNYAGQHYSTDDKVQYLVLDYQTDVAMILQDLARRCRWMNEGDPVPCVWGVDAQRSLYFNFRPDVEVMRLTFAPDQSLRPGQVGVTINALAHGWSDATIDETGLFWNCIGLVGGRGPNAEDGLVRGYYEDTASILKYGRRVTHRENLRYLRSTADLEHYAYGFFHRYADPRASYSVANIPILSAAGFPLPWAGYCEVVREPDATDDPGGHRTMLSAHVNWGAAPTVSLYIGDVIPQDSMEESGNSRTPGASHSRTHDRTPPPAEDTIEGMIPATPAPGGNAWQFIWSED